ncbi:dipeptidyl peptidase 3 [Echinococcus multilocularis]|uniref:Dipeptidyl peptidase 3 n=1 Tax=Echinococcus multilocularis TaxID=6211 RepID=A0A068YK72_ECHMU|nr:dipeptidyl peptidase 3 [Echinococcus multilocularis]
MGKEYVHVPSDIIPLDCKSFDLLSEAEKQYLHCLDEVAWIGGLIDLIQLSPEAAGIFLLGQWIFEKQTVDGLTASAKSAGVSDADVSAFVSYFAAIDGNLGNYLSFGDTKFIPGLSQEAFSTIVTASEAFNSSSEVKDVFDRVIEAIYSLHPRRLRLAFPPDGLTTYYSGDCTREDAEIVQKYLNAKKIEGYNTRVLKSLRPNPDGKHEYLIAFASSVKKEEVIHEAFLPSNAVFKAYYGDLQEIMMVLVDAIDDVKATALNKMQKLMWEKFQTCFRTGSIEAHKEGSKLWVSDKQPVVETYCGFIESYRDPYGVRGEFETFVAVVDKDVSTKFHQLVSSASRFLTLLPWPATYEKDKFLEPDFTSLDIIAFGASGLPVGINIPNYDDIRQTIGFKNVSLRNVLKARFQDLTTTFIRDKDRETYITNVGQSFEIQVGLHELLGHGSGKLFRRNDDGTFNFPSTVRDIITGGDITHWYESGETWDSKFSDIASAFEECRAESVAIYLCDVPEVLHIFDTEEKYDPSDVIFVNWLSMVQAGLMSLEFYTPASNQGDCGVWRQAHCQARFAIFKVLLACNPPVVQIESVQGEDGKPDLRIHLDRSRLQSVAKSAIGSFLQKLQYYKSTGNSEEGIPFFVNTSIPTVEHLGWRQNVLERKKPRPLYVQPVTFANAGNGSVILKNYPGTEEGIIQSFVDRYSEHRRFGRSALAALKAVWEREQQYFTTIPL